MGQVRSNNVSLAYVVEATAGVTPVSPTPIYKALEPEAISGFGATIATVARAPISRQRDLREGIVVDLDSALEFQADATWDFFDDFIEPLMFATMSNRDLIFFAAAIATDAFTVPTMSAGTQAKLLFNASGPTSLVFARGYTATVNNGLHVLDGAVSATSIPVAGSLTDETPLSSGNERLEIGGVRAATGDLAITLSSGQTFTLTSANSGNALDFTDLGLVSGQRIHIGGLTAGNQFSAYVGSARIRTITANAMTMDEATGTPADDDGVGETVDLLFGQFCGNVPTNQTTGLNTFLDRTLSFQAEFPNLFTAGATGYQYSNGNQVNSIALSNALTTKVEATVAMIGRDTANPVSTALAGGDAAFRNPQGTAGYGTSSDFARLRIAGLAGSEDEVCFKSLDVAINNNVSAEKCLNTLGARFINIGNFVIDIQSQLVFTDPDIINAIRANRTVSLEWGYRNGDGEVYFDIPSMKLGGGDREYPVNESVLVNWTGQTFLDSFFNRSMGVSLIPTTPDT